MSTKIWLKPGQGIVDLIEMDKKEGKLPRNLKVETDHDTGEKVITSDVELFDPTSKLPAVPAQYFDRVTYWGIIEGYLRTEGVYRHHGAEMLLVTKKTYTSNDSEIYQEARILARSLESLQEIYSLVRQGKLLPVEDWEQPIQEAAPAK
ncbi:MAG: hypothetical protein WC618_05585 [Patescibacteria group bacterium]